MLNEETSGASREDRTHQPSGPSSEGQDEVELKLLAPAGMLDQIREAPAIVRGARNGSVARRLDAVYYDTPDRILNSHGLSLRVRRSDSGYVQTLKRGPVQGRPLRAANGRARSAAARPTSRCCRCPRLAPHWTSSRETHSIRFLRRRSFAEPSVLICLGAIVEVAFDEGFLEAGERREPLTEIELEVKAGDARVLYDLGIELIETHRSGLGHRARQIEATAWHSVWRRRRRRHRRQSLPLNTLSITSSE